MTMYKNRFGSNLSENQNKKDMLIEEEEEPSKKKLLDIWDIIPSYKDINLKIWIRKIIFVIGILTFFSISLNIITNSITTALIITAFLAIFFTLVLNLNIFHLRNFISKMTQSFKAIKPFESFTFGIAEDDPTTLIIMNKEDM
ncbi:hypothetical protein LCGC14_0574260, partial [marine sediment metagenome]